MNLTLVTPAAVLPVTVAEVSDHCRLDSPTDADEALVETYIEAAATWAFGVSGWTGRSLTDETFEETFDGWTRRVRSTILSELPLARAPVRSVASVKYIDTNGTEQTLASDQHRLVGRNGQGVIVPAYNVTWPGLRTQEANVTVRYVAGYGAEAGGIPQDLRTGLMALVAFMWENRTMAPPDWASAAFRKYQVNWSL